MTHGPPVSPIRRLPVAISVEQLAAAWARTEDAPVGATVVVDHEISGRMRLGIPWQTKPADALACATVLRPSGLPVEAESVLWVVALVAAARAVGVRPGWPDLLFTDDGVQIGAVTLDVQLGPGTIVSAVVSLRVDFARIQADTGGSSLDVQTTRAEAVAAFAANVLRCTDLAEHKRADLLQEYAEVSWLTGRLVRAKLLPKGETRGVAITVDPLGLFVLESPTGMLERLSPVAVLRVDPVE